MTRAGYRSLLPPAVACVWTEAEGDPTTLYAEEAALVSRAVPARRAEFAAVRECAREALAQLGLPPTAVLTGQARAPIWPRGVVGSLTHCAGFRAAAVAPAAEIASVGIDAEVHAPLPAEVGELVLAEGDADGLDRLRAAHPQVHGDRLLFSAKESVYKAWHPLMQQWLGFEECSVEFAADGTFSARLLRPGPMVSGRRLDGFEGRWLVTDQFVCTAIAVPA